MSIEGVSGFQAATGDVALLVDGENLSPAYASALLEIARALGSLRVARVYGRYTHLGDWGAAPGFNAVITGSRPQAADIRISIDSVAMAHGAGVPNFVIASDDRDFTDLAFHLREAGCSVLGVGTAKASSSLRAAFSRFELLSAVAPSVAAVDAPCLVVGHRNGPHPRAQQDAHIRDVVSAACAEKNAVLLSSLGNVLKSNGIAVKQVGCSQWKEYFAGDPERYRLSGEGAGLTVHLSHP